jgi:beta-lactamase class A
VGENLVMLEIVLLLSVAASETPQEMLWAQLEDKVRATATSVNGVVGVVIQDLDGEARLALNEDVVFTQASSIKLPLLVELFRQVDEGRQDLDAIVVLDEDDVVPGSGVLQQLTPGEVRLPLRDFATLMITVSDNTATNMIIDRVGMENVNETMARLGLPHTKLQRKMQDSEAVRADRENLSTPGEQARLLELIYRGEVLSEASREEVLRILSIPKSSRIRALLPPDTRVAHKTGGVPGVSVDVGIVLLEGRPFIVSVMVNWMLERAEAERAMSEIALAAYRYFDRIERSNSYGHKK